MTEFNTNYLKLLREQVAHEIAYLVINGHDNRSIILPCMFCIQRANGHYNCNRLDELRRFQLSIISHGSSKLRVQHERKRIGFPVESEPVANSKIDYYGQQMPLLTVKL